MTYEAFKAAVQDKMRFWFGRIRDDDVVEVNCREAYALGMRVQQTARDIAFGAERNDQEVEGIVAKLNGASEHAN